MMIHKLTKHITYFILSLALASLMSCTQSENLDDLNDTFFVRHRGADMPAYVYGNGAEKVFLIILHGGPGGIGLSYRSGTIKSEIEKKVAVVYFDQRGSGMAQGSYGKDGIGLDIMADDVLALVNVIKHKYGSDSRFFLMGHSWGGTLGTATLLKDQDHFKGWIEVGGSNNPSGLYFEYIKKLMSVAEEQIIEDHNIDYWQGVLDLAAKVNQTTFNLDDFYEMNGKTHDAENKLRDDDVINGTDDDGNSILSYNILTVFWNLNNSSSILADKGLWENLDLTPRLSEITIPTLLLWGKYDLVVPVEFGEDALDQLGSDKKELVVFERSGHSPMANEGDLFAQEVLRFINENK